MKINTRESKYLFLFYIIEMIFASSLKKNKKEKKDDKTN